MKYFLIIFLITSSSLAFTQTDINSARNANYLSADEKEMIKEINLVRSQPKAYIKLIHPYLVAAKEKYETEGKGYKHYSIRKTYINNKIKIDTIWVFANKEELKAIKSLISDLNNLKPLNILKPSYNIYKAAKKHGLDQNNNNWSLSHVGSDGSWPWDRITKFAPTMKYGNENLAGKGPTATSREIVIQLLIDSGISGYGHRNNILNPKWTHVACYYGGVHDQMHRWIQNFGENK